MLTLEANFHVQSRADRKAVPLFGPSLGAAFTHSQLDATLPLLLRKVTATRLTVIRLILCVYLVGGQSEKEPGRSAIPAERRKGSGPIKQNNRREHAADSNFESASQKRKTAIIL